MNNEVITQLLTWDTGQSHLGEDCPPILRAQTAKTYHSDQWIKDSWRVPWDMVNMESLFKPPKNGRCRLYHVTINPDPKVQWMTHCNDRKLHNEKFRELLKISKINNLYTKIICVYEYGKGKKYGKMHWHLLLETDVINKFCEAACKIFGTATKRWRNTVVRKPITCDNNTPDAEKLSNWRHNVRYIMTQYMTKETHNKDKCLFSSEIKNLVAE